MRRELKAEDKEKISRAIKSIRKNLDYLEERMFEASAIFLKDKCDYITHYMDTLYHFVDEFERCEDDD